jgi:hypothetical protein
MSRFHQRLHEDLSDPKFAKAFYSTSADIALLQVLEEAQKALNGSDKKFPKPTQPPAVQPPGQTSLSDQSQDE